MGRRRREPPRHWQFWRSGFWTRPAFIVGYALLAVLIGGWFLSMVPGKVADARAMLHAPECTADGESGCLRRVTAEADGPYSSRGPGDDWQFRTADGRGLGEVDVSASDTGKLDDGATVDVLLWNETVVIVETPAGDRIETQEHGHEGWLFPLGFGLFALGGGFIGVQCARAKRVGARGWWSTWSETPAILLPTPVNLAVAAVWFSVIAGMLAMMFGTGPGMTAAAAAAAGIGLGVVIVWGRRRQRRGQRPG